MSQAGRGLISCEINVCRWWETSPPGGDRVLESMCETGPWDTTGPLLPLITAVRVCESRTLTSDIAVASAQSYFPSLHPSPWVRNCGRAGRKDLVAQQDWLSQARTQAQVLLV